MCRLGACNFVAGVVPSSDFLPPAAATRGTTSPACVVDQQRPPVANPRSQGVGLIEFAAVICTHYAEISRIGRGGYEYRERGKTGTYTTRVFQLVAQAVVIAGTKADCDQDASTKHMDTKLHQ